MKHWILFIALLASSQIIACGPWYPYGDEVRFSLFEPEYFDDGTFSSFYYTTEQFGTMPTLTAENDRNTLFWFQYCNEIVSKEDIFASIYSTSHEDYEDRNTSDPLISYLVKNKFIGALEYISFAKSCSGLNSVYSDWEREDQSQNDRRAKKIKYALKKGRKSVDLDLKQRYNFLAIRLAFYNNDKRKLTEIYNNHFAEKKTKNVVDYWAMHFYAVQAPSSPEANRLLAQVFAHAPSKRFAASMAFNRSVNVAKVIAQAKTDEEKANIYAMYAIRNSGRSEELLREIYSLDPNSEMLKYLLIREFNKLEDWVLTPRYSMFPPSMNSNEYYDDRKKELIAKRIASDKAYAKKLAFWIADMPEYKEHVIGNLGVAYLHGISGEINIANRMLSTISVQKNYHNLHSQLTIVFNVRAGKSRKYLESVQEIIMKEKQSSDFLFAIGRELEYNGKTTLAAFFFSQLNQKNDYFWNDAVWKSPKGAATLWADYYTNWFFYMDGQYSTAEINEVIKHLSNTRQTKFNQWLTKYVKLEQNRLYDLLGTKHMRADKLSKAIAAFKNVKPGLWDSDSYPYKTYLDANPFYTDYNSEHNRTPGDTITYNKLEIAEQLQTYLSKALLSTTQDRSYYYFQAANCYFNMTYHGNSWMMTRYYSSSGEYYGSHEDNGNYYNCSRAKKYYLMAMESATTDNLKALCLRMAGRCEDYGARSRFSDTGGRNNIYYDQLKKDYKSQSKHMLVRCTSFERMYAQYNR